ncbi:MAG: hypothetical protein ACD_19C00176G0037 [uncultured bacterium]|nr:MAG: hypothetical protein ACD_19C00176G0037 [uncultured bacterium]
MTDDSLKSILKEQIDLFNSKELGVEREILKTISKSIKSPHVLVITGLRRVGKSTLLAQIAKRYLDNKFYYVNFEDERLLSLTVKDFDMLHETLISMFGEKKTFLFDEIQNIPEWERFIRRLNDQGYKFIITGSNASLLSQELGTKLTGRHLKVEVFPFSFREYLLYRKFEISKTDILTTTQRGKLLKYQSEYISSGGIPDALKYPDINLHKTLYDDVLYRDIATRYRIDNIKELKELSFYLISNISSLISFNKLKKLLMLGSVNSIKAYVDYFETSWLFFILNKYAYSVKEQQIANKKVYSIDTGLAKSIGFSFSNNLGRLIENIVYLNLRRKQKSLYYYKTQEGYEVDFYSPSESLLIQVSYYLDKNNLERETRALINACHEKNNDHIKNKLIIITQSYKDSIIVEDKKIEIIPLYEWLLKN